MTQVNLAELVKNLEQQESESTKLVQVEKPIDLEFDLGHLLVTDNNSHNLKEIRSNTEKYLKCLTRDNCQLIINKLWDLETERVDSVVVANLPETITKLPRHKPIPKPRPLTKWEQYAKEKGIKTRKKERMIWDEASKTWKPRFGYKRINSEKDDWLLEVPGNNTDQDVDMFSTKKEEKKERVAKNELKRLKNIQRAQKSKTPGINGILPVFDKRKDDIKKAVDIAKFSTASLGKFDEEVKHEKPIKLNKKRKFEDNLADLKSETNKNLEVLEIIQKKKPLINTEKAVNSFISSEEKERAEENKANPKKKVKPRKAGGRRRGFVSKNQKLHSGKKGKRSKSGGDRRQMSGGKGRGKGR